ncbi:hypothetical protein ABZU94_08710 [Streptomyces mirabilis]|uniref:hypothetical protein n=1 Tax=Streptomyces sp. NPDC005388 TaxID=3156717 RepID=UPI0033A3D49D
MADLDSSRCRAYARNLHQHLDALGNRRTEAIDLVRAQGRRTFQDLNARAQQATSTVTRQVAEAWSGEWDAHCGEWGARERETEGRKQLVALTLTAVAPWRADQERQVTEQLAALDHRLRERLGHDLDALREKVTDLLGVELSLA